MKSFAIIATFLLTGQALYAQTNTSDWVRDKHGNMIKQNSIVKYYDRNTECEGQVKTVGTSTWKVTVDWYRVAVGKCPKGGISANDLNALANAHRSSCK